MSKQLTLSAVFSVLAMAAFVLASPDGRTDAKNASGAAIELAAPPSVLLRFSR